MTKEVLKGIFATGTKFVINLSGGGGSLAQFLLSTAGCSNSLLELTIPYAKESTVALLGFEPDKFVALAAGRDLAESAYHRAVSLCGKADAVTAVGVGVTAALASLTPKKGKHEVIVGVHTRRRVVTYALEMEKGARAREEEDELVGLLALRAMAESAGVDFAASDLPLREGERVVVESTPNYLEEVLAGERLATLVDVDGAMHPVVPGQTCAAGTVLVPGSFNPLHEGHSRLGLAAALKIASQTTGSTTAPDDAAALRGKVVFEFAAVNADKGSIAPAEVARRLKQFRKGLLDAQGKSLGFEASVVVTRCPLYAQKAALFPGCSFAVGYDTAERILNPKYYPEGLEAGLQGLRACTVVVGGRIALDPVTKLPAEPARFLTLGDLQVPSGLKDMFLPLSEPEFRDDISSSLLRQRASAKIAN